MDMTRRQLAKGLSAAAMTGVMPRAAPQLLKPDAAMPSPAVATAQSTMISPGSLPLRNEFTTGQYEVCLNNARWHPMSKGSRQAVIDYLDYKQRGIWNPPDLSSAIQHDVKVAYGKLINADVSELAYVNSTTAGESLFVSTLGFPQTGGNIVTDALHFEGSLYLYDALKKQGMDVRVVHPVMQANGWRISRGDMENAIDKDTRLVAISHVSFINGFEHDVKAICDLAHARGALVYVDAVQAAGAIPIDVRASGVDAVGSASYKWLMGDMGIGFLFVRQEILPRLKRTQFGYRQLSEFDYHVFPWDSQGTYPVDWKQSENAAGYFEIGTYDNATIAALSYSLPLIQRIGVEQIQTHAQRLLVILRKELTKLGYPCITPEESRAPIASFLVADGKKTAAALKMAKIDVSQSRGRMRISPSMYNDEKDVQQLLAALAG